MIKVFSPSGLSGFFAPYITSDISETGSIGGGVTIDKGVIVTVEDSIDGNIYTYINKLEIKNSIAEYMALKLMNEANVTTGLIIKQEITPPIGYGYGTSAASALATGLAVARYLNINKTLYDIGKLAHETEVIFRTGLGTVQGLLNPGIVLVREPGEPGRAFVDNILYDEDIFVVTSWYTPIKTSEVIGKKLNLEYITYLGKKTLEKILRDPSPHNMMIKCWEFAQKAGFLTPRIENIINTLWAIDGVIGVTQNMIGEAFFALTYREGIEEIKTILEKEKNIIVSKVTDKKPYFL